MGVAKRYYASFRKKDRWTQATLLVIFFAIFLRIVIASYTVEGGDPCYHLSVGKFIAENWRIPSTEYLGREIFRHEPLFHIVAGIFYTIFDPLGLGDFGMHLVSALFGSGTVILTYLIARKLWNKQITLFATIFSAFLPLAVYQSTTAHVDMIGTFFSILSAYLLLEKRPHLGAISFGLALLSRINSIVIAPLLLYILFYNNRQAFLKFIKASFIFFLLALLVASPWYARNYMVFHNPVFPFANDLFQGTYHSIMDEKPNKLGHLLDVRDSIVDVHLALFGVPDGKVENLSFFQSTLFKAAIALWLLLTILSIIPFLFSLRHLFSLSHRSCLLILGIIPFVGFLYYYQYGYGNTSTRYLLSAIPFIAILWGIGVEWFMKRWKLLTMLFLLAFSLGFASSEAAKSAVITMQWHSIEGDLQWIQEHTPKDALFIVPGQCLGYRMERQSYPARTERITPSLDPKPEEVDYFLDMRNKVERDLPKEVFTQYGGTIQKVYENPQTGVTLYQRS